MTTNADEQSVQQSSLGEKAYWQLKDAILHERLPLEEALSEARLAEQLGMSRTPVREALYRLEAEGFISNVGSRGVVVRPVSAEFVFETLEYREAVESFACRLATERVDDAKLKQICELCLKAAPPTDADDLNRIARFFHGSIRDACGNATLQQGLDRIHDQLDRVRSVARNIPGRIQLSYVERRPVVAAMANRDGEAAELAMREHIRSTRRSIVEALLRRRTS
jgi:GntR family transcriptional regulator, rspAB operon transcriptional repressor